MDFKNLLGTVSPLYGAMSGEGMLGKVLNPDAAAKIAEKAKNEEEERRAAKARKDMEANVSAASNRRAAPANPSASLNAATNTKKMKNGGKVSSASRRGDGCAQRGKTKGRFV